MNGEGIMSGEEGADQCMSCRGVCVGMQMNERDSKRDARYELRDHRRDHQEHPNWDEWAVCPARYAYQRSQTLDWLTVAANALQRTLVLPTSRDKRCRPS